ncbi:MAG: VCBS repeat-containing protein [Chloroflexota bacterium]
MRQFTLFLLTTFLLFMGCKNENNALFTLLPASVTHADFNNSLDYSKQLESKFNIYTFRNFYNGGGVGLADINNDGMTDIFMTSNMGKNTLYLNKGNFRFEDISEKAGIQGEGWSTGVSMADVNGDGHTDIYVCKSGNIRGVQSRNELYINNGDLTFTNKASEYGIDEHGNSTQGVFFDYDKDNDLDLYVLKNFPKAISAFNLKDNLRELRDSTGGHKLFRNDGDRFTDVSREAGIYGSLIAFGLGVTAGDINLDGWTDLYVANDFFERDYIYINNHDGTFSECLTSMMPSISAASMGGDMADLNNDIWPEVFATDMIPEHNDRLKTKTTFDDWNNYKSNADNGYHHQFTRNVLQLNNGDGTFSEIGRFAGVAATDWSWGALIMDMDNDGMKDIFVANGIYKDLTDQDYIQYFSNRDVVMSIMSGNKIDYKALIDAIPSVKIPSYAFKNIGNNRFKNVADEWGLADPSFSNGSAYADLDNDGDLDLIVNNVNMPMFIYRNNSETKGTENHYLKLILKGAKGNTDALGAKILAIHEGKKMYLEQIPTRGYLSTVDNRPNLGLGPVTVLDSLIVQWPDGGLTILTDVKTDQTLTLEQKDGIRMDFSIINPPNAKDKMFEDLSNEKILEFTHKEDNFNDFEREPLIFHMMSTEGPGMCSADVNGDGMQDIFIGGARGQAGCLFIQQSSGRFTKLNVPAFEADKLSEDTGCEFFDADGDDDKDLYVASGGNEFPESSSALNDRLYINDGKGGFKRSDQILPAWKYENTSCVRAADFDNDGTEELFVGIRLKPFAYGVPVNGYILENDGKGNLRNVTDEIAPGLTASGMIRDMSWADVDGDKDQDILIAGDWMPLKVFLNEGGRFRETKTAFDSTTSGWWNCITTGDLDNDGDIDFVAGNHGLNSRFKATGQKPVSMYINDFDMNGAVEQIVCTFDGDISYPVPLKHDLVNQIPELMRKYPKYEMYKDQKIDDIFSPAQLKNSIRLQADLLETSVFLNDGNGNFTRVILPDEVQFSPVYAAIINDFNGDGNPDILMGGNMYNAKPEVGRYDAGYGYFLAGDGTGRFRYIPPKSTGCYLDGETRGLLLLKGLKGDLLVVARNNGPVKVFKPLKENSQARQYQGYVLP